MNPWSTILQSLQSSTLEELASRFPDAQKELGMPAKQTSFMVPALNLDLLYCEISFTHSPTKGIALFGIDDSLAKAAQLTTEQFWESILKKSGGEFKKRNMEVYPILGKPELIEQDVIPPILNSLKVVIWIPMKLDAGQCFVGLGI